MGRLVLAAPCAAATVAAADHHFHPQVLTAFNSGHGGGGGSSSGGGSHRAPALLPVSASDVASSSLPSYSRLGPGSVLQRTTGSRSSITSSSSTTTSSSSSTTTTTTSSSSDGSGGGSSGGGGAPAGPGEIPAEEAPDTCPDPTAVARPAVRSARKRPPVDTPARDEGGGGDAPKTPKRGRSRK